MTSRVGRRVFPTLTQPLPTREALRAEIAEDEAWEALFERPLGETLARALRRRHVRGIALTDALIGTFAAADEPSLRQNRCFLYHVIGNGDGPLGRARRRDGRGHRRARRARAAEAGAELRCGVEVTRDRRPRARCAGTGGEAQAGHVLANVAPRRAGRAARRARRRSRRPRAPSSSSTCCCAAAAAARRRRGPARGVRRAPSTSTSRASQLPTAYAQADAGAIPDLPPCEIYCHSLTDPTILGPELRDAGAQTLTCFGAAHAGAAVPGRPEGAKARGDRGHAALAGLRARRADRGLPVAHAGRRAVPGGAHARRSSRPSSGCPAGTSSTATSPGPTRRARARPAAGASRRPTRRCCCAGRARGAAAGVSGSPAATPRWPSCGVTSPPPPQSWSLRVTVPFMNGWTRQ